ncbi:MAG: hypothetical protein ABMA64_12655 [Myxococcota bacterium]
MADDVWSPAGSKPTNDADLPEVMSFANQLMARAQKDFVPFLLAGLGPLIIALVVVTPLALVSIYGGMFVGMAPGLVTGDEDLAGFGSIFGMLGGFGVLFGVVIAVTAPMSASTNRAVWKYLNDGEPLTFMAPFSTFTQDLVKVVSYAVIHGGLVMLGAMFCYVPGLIVAAALVFAGPAIYVHGLGIGQAISLSVAHVQKHPGWHVGFFGLAIVMNLVLSYVPFIGAALLATLMPLYILLAYKHFFGDGPTPREAGVDYV